MANEYYSESSAPSTGASLASATIRNEFIAIGDGFDKLPTLAGNGGEIIAVNAGATALEAIATTGTGSGVRATSPTLVTPILGVATATSINKVAITAPASSATLTIANGKTLTASNTVTITADDGATLGVGGGIAITTGKILSCSNTLTLAGTDGTTININAVTNLNRGEYTPTFANLNNLASVDVVASEPWKWTRVGDMVRVAGLVSSPASSAALCSFTATLPVSTSNFTANGMAAGGGTYSGTAYVPAQIIATAGAQTVDVVFIAADTGGGQQLAVEFTYQIQ